MKTIPSSWRTELEDELEKLVSVYDAPSTELAMINALVQLIDNDMRSDRHLIKIDVIKRLIRAKGVKNRPLFDSYLITV